MSDFFEYGGSSALNVKSIGFGAKGDGVTDDTAAIQRALNVVAPSGGQVYLPAGKYVISGTLTLPPIASNLRGGALLGAGHNATQLYLKTGSNVDMILVNGQFWKIADLNLDANYPGQSAGNGIVVNFTKTILQNLYIANTKGDGVQLVGASQTAHAAFLSNLYIFSCQGNGINASTQAYDLKADNIWIGSGGAAGVLINSTQQHWNNLHCWGNAAEGVKVTAGDQCRFTNCYVETNGSHGLSINNAKGCIISGSVVRGNVGHGVYLFNAPQTVVTGCQIVDNSNGVANQDGLRGDGTSTDCVVTGNYFGINNDGGVVSNQKYGINMVGTTDRWTIVGNNIRASQEITDAYVLRGTNLVFNTSELSPVQLNNPYANAALQVTQTGNASASASTGGAVNINNTGSTGAGLVIYSTQAAPSGRLLNVNANSATFAQAAANVTNAGTGDALQVTQSGTGIGLNLTAAGGATANKHAVSVGLTNTGSTSSSAMNITSANTAASSLQVTGVELSRGSIKVAHVGDAGGLDGNASGISIDLQTAGTAAQGIFLDATTGATTGKLIHLKNGGAEKFSIDASGKLQYGNSANFATTVGAAGGATALPATPVKYMIILDDLGTSYKVPVYNV